MFTSRQLAILANAYSGHTGKSLSWLGISLFKDHQFFKRLNTGMDCVTLRAAEASEWFIENWPADAPWPDSVPRVSSEAAE